MIIDFASFSGIGPRDSNQDRLLLPTCTSGNYFLAAIADGIGGALGGEEAAETAVEMTSKLQPAPEALSVLFEQVVSKLRKRAAEAPDYDKMGTTLSVAVLENGKVSIAHVGDTRIYHLRGQGLNSLTSDQTEVAELVRKGVLTPQRARRYPRRNVLLSALSPKGEFEVQETSAALEDGDRLLFLTDGVYRRLTRGAILNASLAHCSVRAFLANLEKLTIAAEPSDNFSALAIQIVEAG